MPSTDKVKAEERHWIWDGWLEGHSLNDIHRWDGYPHSVPVIKAVLAEEPPESIKTDGRYIHRGKFIWIRATGEISDGKPVEFVIAKMPRRCTTKALHKALRAIVKDACELHPGLKVDPCIAERLEPEIALRYVDEKGRPGWSIDEEGDISGMVPSPCAHDDTDAPSLR